MGVARSARFLPGGWGSLLVAVVVILVLSSLPSPAAALVRGRHQISEKTAMSSSFNGDGGAAQGSSSPSSLRRALLGERNTHARPDYDYYLSKTATMAEVARIVSMHPGFMRVDTMESTRDGYSSSLTVVTVEPGGFGTGGEDGEEKKKKRVLYNYGEHGRELITVDVAVQLLRDLARGVEHVARLADPAAVSQSLNRTPTGRAGLRWAGAQTGGFGGDRGLTRFRAFLKPVAEKPKVPSRARRLVHRLRGDAVSVRIV